MCGPNLDAWLLQEGVCQLCMLDLREQCATQSSGNLKSGMLLESFDSCYAIAGLQCMGSVQAHTCVRTWIVQHDFRLHQDFEFGVKPLQSRYLAGTLYIKVWCTTHAPNSSQMLFSTICAVYPGRLISEICLVLS